jgi:exonuclease VII small subunit
MPKSRTVLTEGATEQIEEGVEKIESNAVELESNVAELESNVSGMALHVGGRRGLNIAKASRDCAMPLTADVGCLTVLSDGSCAR